MARWVSLALLATVVAVGPPQAALASSWTVGVHAGSLGEAVSQALPAAPTGVAAACTSGLGDTVKVTWVAVPHATSYSVYEATAAATGPYSQVASGITATTWTSPGLASGHYWFEVTAYVGTNWQSPNSLASGETTISLLLLCSQP